MLRVAAAALLSAASAAGASEGAPAALELAEPRLAVRLRPDLTLSTPALAVEPARAADPAGPPPCVADWCQARVEVPGMGYGRGRPSRTELFVTLMDRAGIEPVATIAWFFMVTGLRIDWSPANADESYGATAGGWGNVMVRLRLRVDAFNRPAIPIRPRVRMQRQRELAAERERAKELERQRGLVAPQLRVGGEDAAQRPARRSST